MKIWDLAIRQPVFMTMILSALVVLGAYAYIRLPVDLFPDIEVPIVAVNTVYPGASPEEVESQVTRVIEEGLSALPGVTSVSSTSSEGVSFVLLEFNLNTSDQEASRIVLERLNRVSGRLPDGAADPIVLRFDPSDQPILTFGVADATGQLSPVELRRTAEEMIQRPLERIDGVAAVNVNGGEVREIQINLNQRALQSRMLTPQQVSSAIQTENLNIPGGSITADGQQLLVRTPGNFQNVSDLQNVVVAFRGAPVYLRDVAEVVDGFAERNTLTRLNGQDSVVITIQRQSGTNTTQVAREVKRVLDDIRVSNPNLNIAITEDTSLFIEASTEDAVIDLILGALIAFFVVLYFFRSVRNTFITMSGLPVIFLGTLFLMDAFGLSLNLVTLLALALVVGLVIDDAIVVRENIFRWMERGYSAKEAASKGTAEVVLPVLATSATILAVFLPIAYAEGIVGQIFLAFGLTVAFAIIVSTFEALTLAPMLSAYFFGKGEDKERQIDENAAREEEEGRSKLDRAYGRALGWVLDHRWLSLGISVIVIGVSVGSATLLNVSFLPPLDQGRLTVRMEMPPGTPLNVTSQEAQQVESILMMHPDIELVSTRVGGQGTPENARFSVVLRDGGNSRIVIEQLREPLQAVPGVSFQGTDSAFGAGRDVQVDLISLDGNYSSLIAASEMMAEMMAARPELADIEVSYEAAKSELQFRVDRQQAAQFGFTTAQVGSSLRTLLNGEVVSSFRGEGADADIRMRLQESDRSSVEQLRQISLLSSNGQFVPISSIATTGFAQGPSEIQRVDRQATITVGANAVAGDRVAATAAANEILADLGMLPAGVTARLGGNAGQQADSFQNLFLALGLSVIFIYMVLASQFASFVQPLIIMISMPLAVLGAFAGLVITGRPLDTTAFIGFIMLMGLVTKNSILLVDFANRQRRELGRTATEAMRIAGPVRLRPILMTAISLILAMIPIASGLGAGGDFRAPMATGIIGGMFTSTLLTLFIVPLAYSVVVGWQEKRFGREAPWAAANLPASSPSPAPVQQPQEALQAGD